MEIKPSNRARKLQESKLKKQKQKAVLKRQRDDEQRWHMEMRSDSWPKLVTLTCFHSAVTFASFRGWHRTDEKNLKMYSYRWCR